MDATLEPIMQPVAGLQSVSGTDIINDLCDRIADRLSRHDCLRATDSYKRYALKAEIILQLVDVDTTEVTTAVDVNSIDPAQPVERIALGDSVDAGESEGNLERPIDSAGAAEAPVKRQYISRLRQPRY